MSYGDGIDAALLAHLRGFDTPTICNALEIAIGRRRATGFTRTTMIAPFPLLPPIMGFARTATLRSAAPSSMDAGTARELRLAYYAHVAPIDCPTVVDIQDLDTHPGLGAFWGEVNSTVHCALGCAGVVTNGAVRDLDALDPEFPIIAGCVTPSHAFVRIGDRLRCRCARHAGGRWRSDPRRPPRRGTDRPRGCAPLATRDRSYCRTRKADPRCRTAAQLRCRRHPPGNGGRRRNSLTVRTWREGVRRSYADSPPPTARCHHRHR